MKRGNQSRLVVTWSTYNPASDNRPNAGLWISWAETANGMHTYHNYDMETEGDTIPAQEGKDWIEAFHKRRDRAKWNMPHAADKE